MEHFGRLDKGDDSGPKENDKLKDCCAEVYEGFKKFGKKWYKFKLFRKINGLDETMGDSTMITTADDDEDLDGEEDEAVAEGSSDDETKNAGDVSNFHFDQETNMINVPVKKEVKQEIKSEPMDEVEGIHKDAHLPEV